MLDRAPQKVVRQPLARIGAACTACIAAAAGLIAVGACAAACTAGTSTGVFGLSPDADSSTTLLDGADSVDGGGDAISTIILGPPCGDYASAVCPSTPPQAGGACPAYGLNCEIGSASKSVTCNPRAFCGGDCKWLIVPADNPTCSSLPADCAPDFASVPRGGSCTPAGSIASCIYPEGECTCASSPGGPAGWSCTQPPAGCPVPRPLLGASCTQDGFECQYVPSCSSNEVIRCVQGHWQRTQGNPCG